MLPFLLALGVAVAAPQDGRNDLRDAIRRFDREAALRAARALLEQGSRAAVDQLLSALDFAADEEEAISRTLTETRRTERRVFHEYRKSSENVDRPRLLQELQQLEKNILGLEERIALVRAVRELVTEGMGKITDARATQFLLERMSASGSWPTRHACAYAAAFNSTLPFETAVPALLRLLETEKHPLVRIQIIDALRARRDKREAVVHALHRRLEGDPWPVAAAAVEFLQEIAAPQSVPVLIDAMARYEGRLRNDIRDALATMTGESRPADPATWKTWWDANGDAFLNGTYSPPGGQSATVGFYTDFFGIPVRSSRILFVLDRSDSMGQRARWKAPEPDPSLPADVKLGGDTKL
ncbi:MAG TPA: HEAT repeat domain-containing protein, partial [Planctomycetota bacterium]|nr:HEAT repeat domain-containing protein [Planctomycetota bacterium]